MRVDKYLWAVRYYKSRNAASTACRKGYVQLGGQNAKPSREVYVSDKISIRRQQLTVEIYVLDIPKSRVGAKLVSQYCKDITPQEALDLKNAADEINACPESKVWVDLAKKTVETSKTF